MVDRTRTEATWVAYREALRLFLRGATVGTATRIALVVGTWLSFMNQGRAIADGHTPWVAGPCVVRSRQDSSEGGGAMARTLQLKTSFSD